AAAAHPPQLTPGSAPEASDLLDQTSELLLGMYQERARLWGATAASMVAAKTPAQALELLIDRVSAGDASQTDHRSLANLPYERIAGRFLAADELQYTVAAQRMLVAVTAEHVAKQRPQQAVAVETIKGETWAAAKSAKSVLVQLRDQELA